MNEQALAKLESWLRYYEDLGLGTFYCAREAPPARPEKAAAGVSLPAPPVRQSPRGAGIAVRGGAPPPAPAVRQPLPIVASPTLFAAAERVEGDTLERIRADIGDCTRCKLHEGRHHIVFGDGNPRAELVFVGEGPGEEEDRQGLPFVGRAGKLLTQMIEAMGLRREDVYIANVVKCRPPQNRAPERDEMATCLPFLERQLAAIAPKVIVCLGNVAAQALLGGGEAMGKIRGEWFDWRGAKLLPTYHPAYLLRNPAAKSIVWEDLQKVMAALGYQPPPKRRRP
ncbi:MAG TPA: uracil-DNA glycosylase [Candidatus Acidoferrales bacterium]|nr:uracil-DNA glycosylase [Candidatus Acidoferrales bacterium]